MSWATLGRENLKASRHAKEGQHWRTSVSRAYYAAFDALNEVLLRVENPPARYRTHLHRQIPDLIKKHLTGFLVTGNRALRTTVTRLYKARLAADYDERVTHDDLVAQNALRDAYAIFHELAVDHG